MLKFNVPYLSGHESEMIDKVLNDSTFCGNGFYSQACENYLKEKFGFENCFLTPSCTAAIEMASLILDLKPSDEIIIPSYTFASCPNPFLIKGNKIVLADCQKDYPNISIKHVESLISPNTKAIMVMHYGGIACDIEAIKNLCEKHHLYLIEDAAQCINAYYKNKPLGSFGDLAVFSFHETKNVHCGEGGAIVINNSNLLEKAQVVRQYGTNRTAFLEGKTSHYESVGLGLALFQSEINAAFLYAQLQKLDEITNKRKMLWMEYHNQLNTISSGNFELVDMNLSKGFNAHNFFIKLNNYIDIDEFISYLNENGIQAVKHFYPLHLSIMHQNNISSAADLPNANQFNNKLVRLPLHLSMSSDNIVNITKIIAQFFSV